MLRAGGCLCEIEWNCLKCVKTGWNRTDGKGNKNFKNKGRGKLGQEVDALKRGAGTLLQTMLMSFRRLNRQKKVLVG